jgi:mRNA-degrading endonuclease toxin of MazEF toxin-antitoxin module
MKRKTSLTFSEGSFVHRYFSERHGLPARVDIGAADGLKHDSAIQRDGLMSIERARLTDFVSELSTAKLRELDAALVAALGL